MPRLNELQCAESLRNVGTSGCVLEPGLIKGFFIGASDFSFDAAAQQDIQDRLQDLLWADNAAQRLIMLSDIVDLTDNSGDPVTETFGYGGQTTIRDNFNDWTVRYRDGGLCRHSALRTWSGDSRRLLFWDDKNRLFGSDRNGSLINFPSSVYVPSWKTATGSATTVLNVKFNFDPKYINESVGVLQLDFDPAVALRSLQDLVISVNSFNPNTGVVNAKIVTYCGGTDMYDLYSTQLAVVGAFSATNSETGAQITVSTVAKQASDKTFNITLSTADADYPTTGGVIRLKLASPSVLAGLGVEGYDSVAASLEVPAS